MSGEETHGFVGSVDKAIVVFEVCGGTSRIKNMGKTSSETGAI